MDDQMTDDSSIDISITDEVESDLDLMARTSNPKGPGYIEQES